MKKLRGHISLAILVSLLALGTMGPSSVKAATTTASTATEQAVTPSGPPAPDGFRDTVKRIHQQAASYAGLPGLDQNAQPTITGAPMSNDAFSQVVDGLTADQLNELYDSNPAGWARLDATMSAVTSKTPPPVVASAIGQAYAATAAPPPSPAPAAEGAPGADYTPPAIKRFEPTKCPATDVGGDDGYDLLFALETAADTAKVAAQRFYASFGGKTLATHLVLAGVVTAAAEVAFALEVPAQTVELLINLDRICAILNADTEIEVVDENLFETDHTTIAILNAEHQLGALEDQINQLLDKRTQTIVSQLDTAQASLDKAQQQAIESALAGGQALAIASYELPASLGGWLDSKPIGVQAIVTNAMANLQTAGQAINSTASSQLAAGNAALAAHQYKAAFFDYQTAYQAMLK